jgi:hypothetical protein
MAIWSTSFIAAVMAAGRGAQVAAKVGLDL